MKKIGLIAQNTYLEIIRDRILYGLVVFAVLLIGLSLALGQLSFSEQARIALDFGLVGIQLSSVILAMFVGSTLVSKEIEKQTILTILSRPIRRSEFIVGKFVGLASVLLTVLVGLACILALITYLMETDIGLQFVIALLGIVLEALTLLAITMLLGVVIRPFLTVSCVIGVFLIGHWIPSLLFFSQKSESPSFKILGKIISWVLPNLERFNWRAAVIYQDAIDPNIILSATAYGLGWIVILISITNIIFRRKDFV